MASSAEVKSKADAKLIILGCANIGKTCLIQRYLNDKFADTISSVGASLALKRWEDWTVAVWDTAGEEKYAALSAFYCRGASVAILAFDLTDATSLDKLIETFIPLLEDSVTNCLTLVAGTKLDLVDTKGRQIKSSQGEELAEELYRTQLESAKGVQDTCLKGLDPKRLYFETSAKTGEGVGGLFEHAQSVLLPLLRKTMPKGTKSSSKITVLNSEPPAGKSRCCSS
ncbi:ras-related protein Rab-20-like [Halichondria panicea]|uniref:ras-related protein Rab-20-like n=1 Tax=Halichondria panicea TaxID=6063 RepID=UPI00312B8C2D